MEVKDNSKRDAAQIKRLETSKAAPVNSDSDDSIRVPCKKKVRNGVLPSHKQHGEKTPKRHRLQRYLLLCKKEVMPEQKYKSHSLKIAL